MKQFFENQIPNYFLWTPFIVAFGAALYFSLSFEPSLIYSIVFTCGLFGALIAWHKNILLRAICIFACGFTYAAIYAHVFAPPQISRNLRDITITGIVQNIDYSADKTRLYINAQNLNPNSVGDMIVRVSVSDDSPIPNIGDNIRGVGALFRPSAAYAPASFDYARWAYFNNLSATGFISDIEIINETGSSPIRHARGALHDKAQSFLADSLVLGYKQSVPDADAKIWQAAGISHVWSISGFHMTLVSGWLFAIFYFLFRVIPFVTRRVPARIPAMICAAIGLWIFLMLSGAGTATIRAFIMSALIFGAAIFGRNAASMRNICMAFLVLFIINPHSVMQAGFQLSFAAVFGLIWLWGNVKPKMPDNKFIKIIYAAALTSLVATIFTLPFIASHFYAVPMYSLIGNLILLPIFSFIIMPLVVIGTGTAAIGILLPLNIAAHVYDIALWIADKIASMPFATLGMPHIPNTAMILTIIGFLCLMLVRNVRLRLNIILFIVFQCAAIIAIIIAPRPVFFASPDHELVAFRTDNKIEFNKSRASNHFFAFDTWKQISNIKTDTPNIRRKHRKGLYIFETKNFNLAYMQKFTPLYQNINRLCHDDNIDYIISYFDIDAKSCHNKILPNGGLIIYETGKIITMPTSRPWHNPRR